MRERKGDTRSNARSVGFGSVPKAISQRSPLPERRLESNRWSKSREGDLVRSRTWRRAAAWKVAQDEASAMRRDASAGAMMAWGRSNAATEVRDAERPQSARTMSTAFRDSRILTAYLATDASRARATRDARTRKPTNERARTHMFRVHARPDPRRTVSRAQERMGTARVACPEPSRETGARATDLAISHTRRGADPRDVAVGGDARFREEEAFTSVHDLVHYAIVTSPARRCVAREVHAARAGYSVHPPSPFPRRSDSATFDRVRAADLAPRALLPTNPSRSRASLKQIYHVCTQKGRIAAKRASFPPPPPPSPAHHP